MSREMKRIIIRVSLALLCPTAVLGCCWLFGRFEWHGGFCSLVSISLGVTVVMGTYFASPSPYRKITSILMSVMYCVAAMLMLFATIPTVNLSYLMTVVGVAITPIFFPPWGNEEIERVHEEIKKLKEELKCLNEED